ncbi:MAG: GDP-L-fucose synthase [Sphingomonadaceae bacterium]|nr:GDP-L-fucose synthase [Sphingomonadaceae bacterium]
MIGKRIFVAGHNGMVGRAIVRRLGGVDCTILTAPRDQLDLTDKAAVDGWFATNRPEIVFLAAAKVGGIHANNSLPVDFLRDNLHIELAVIEAAHRHGVEKLIFLGSSCIYPKLAAQPIVEEALLSGPLEETNIWYAIAKIAGIKLCQAYRRQYGCNFIAAQPTNLYGPDDNFDLATSHVLPALIRKAVDARDSGADTLTIWGSGTPLREFMHVDDLADALCFLAENYDDEAPINVGSGQEVSIAELATIICRQAGFAGQLAFDATKPDGTPRKRIDSTKLTALGWQAQTPLETGIADTIGWYERMRAEGAVRGG